jgi:hypothetical protein
VDALAADRPGLPVSADVFVVHGGCDPCAWRMGRKLDGRCTHLPLRTLGRTRLGPGAARDQEKLLVAAMALRRLEGRLSRAA